MARPRAHSKLPLSLSQTKTAPETPSLTPPRLYNVLRLVAFFIELLHLPLSIFFFLRGKLIPGVAIAASFTMSFAWAVQLTIVLFLDTSWAFYVDNVSESTRPTWIGLGMVRVVLAGIISLLYLVYFGYACHAASIWDKKKRAVRRAERGAKGEAIELRVRKLEDEEELAGREAAARVAAEQPQEEGVERAAQTTEPATLPLPPRGFLADRDSRYSAFSGSQYSTNEASQPTPVMPPRPGSRAQSRSGSRAPSRSGSRVDLRDDGARSVMDWDDGDKKKWRL